MQKSFYKKINADFCFFAFLAVIFLAYSARPYYDIFRAPHIPREAQLLMQCLDFEWMKQSFWECVIYNHYQPPLFFNFFLGGVYKFFPGLLYPLFYSLSFGLSFLALGILIWLCERLNLPRWITFIIGLSYIFQPSRIELEHFVIYTAPCLFSITFSLFFFRRFLERRRTFDFLLFSISCAIPTLMNSSFHYGWAIGAILIAFFLAPSRNLRLKISTVAVCLLILVIPLKNLIVFGFLGSSSCSGFVIAYRIKIPQNIKVDHFNKGDVSAVFVANGNDFRLLPFDQFAIPKKFNGIPCLTKKGKDYIPENIEFWRPERVFNYNHYSSLKVNQILVRDSLWLFKKYPGYYLKATIPQINEFFSLDTKRSSFAGLWMKIQGWVFLFCFPLGVLYFVRHIKQTPWEPSQKFIVLLLYNLAYSIFIGIMISWGDGERYRYPFETCYLLMAGFLLSELLKKRKAKPLPLTE